MQQIIAKLPSNGGCGWTDIYYDGELTASIYGTATVCIGLIGNCWMIEVRIEHNLLVACFYADAIISR